MQEPHDGSKEVAGHGHTHAPCKSIKEHKKEPNSSSVRKDGMRMTSLKQGHIRGIRILERAGGRHTPLSSTASASFVPPSTDRAPTIRQAGQCVRAAWSAGTAELAFFLASSGF